MRRALAAILLASAACSGPGLGVSAPDAAGDSALPAPDSAVPPKGPFPIVLAHGLFGFRSIGPLDYWYGIVPAMEADGRVVYADQVDPIQSSDVRGAQLVQQIEQVKAMTGAPKVVVIGHSQGGLDARWAAAHDPDSIAAVITIATPHLGSPVGDVAAGLLPGDSSAALDVLADLFGVDDSDISAVLATLTSTGAAAFNAATPNDPNIPYWSVAGRSNFASADDCPPSSEITSQWDSQTDPMKAVLLPVDAIMEAAVPSGTVNDGLVTLPSAQWGTFLGCVPADHFDEVCQIAGESAGIGNDFDCLQLYHNLDALLTANQL